jgi:hypothetical protein
MMKGFSLSTRKNGFCQMADEEKEGRDRNGPETAATRAGVWGGIDRAQRLGESG